MRKGPATQSPPNLSCGEQYNWELIRRAVIEDDVKSLEKLLVDKESFSLAFGRFPILSLAYLYSSYKVVKKYEKILSGIKEYNRVEENYEDYLLFKKRAKKSLRLYLNNQIVTPIEMGAVLCDSQSVSIHLKETQNIDRVKKIYRLTHNVAVKKKGNSFVVPRSKKPNHTQLVAVLTIICICAVFLSGAIVAMEAVPPLLGGDGTIDNPIKILSTSLFELALNENDRYYTLESNLTIDADKWTKKDFKIHLNGQGNTLTIKGARDSALIEKLSGSLINTKIVFTEVSNELPLNSAYFVNSVSGKIENVSFYFEDLALTVKSEGALVAYVSTGTFSNIDLIANGNINEVSALEETIIGTLLYKNVGIISDCNVKYNLNVTGDAKEGRNDSNATTYGDAVFGGIVGINNATIKNSTVVEGSSLSTDTLDVGGIAVENVDKATITSVTNYASLTQSTDSSFWSPNIGGITMRNYGKITSSINHGNIKGSTTQTDNTTAIILGGITTINSGTIDKCVNNGSITGDMVYGHLNLGGMGYLNEGTISNCTNNGAVSGTTTTTKDDALEQHVAGGLAVNNGTLSYFKNTGNITSATTSGGLTFVGGAVAINNDANASIENTQNLGKITANTTITETKAVFVGGISAYMKGSLTNSFNLGSFTTTSEEGTVIAGGIIGFTEIQGYYGYNNYAPAYNWAKNYYLSDNGFSVGVGNYYVYEYDPFFHTIVKQYYAEGEDVGATPSDLESIKNSGVYW
ncbi:MAG: hypothetical protein IKB56_03775 [Clostridia bacterium]|nr:hypothetical protein [Clostridia bacterium]